MQTLLCRYTTPRVLHIHSTSIGTVRSVFLAAICIYIGFALVSDKMYQRKEPVISSVHAKVKGVAEVTEEVVGGEKRPAQRVFDTADYTFSLQGNSFFMMTNYLITEGQEQGRCPQFPTRRTLCLSDQDCKKGWLNPQNQGIQTGKCVEYNTTAKTCEVSAWCPTEVVEEAPRPALLGSAENFTVLIKNNVDFPGHNYTTRNILPGLNASCIFHKTQDPQCPIFRLGDIFRDAGDNFSEVAVKGGIMGIEINWDCNLDRWFHRCRPKYSFRRLDDKTARESLYPGYNFRYAKYYRENNVEKRTLMKVFGIRFDILVFGTGGKFNIISLIVYMGSTLSYFGLATVFIDLLINTYSSAICRSHVYPWCPCCKPCAANEYYYHKKCEVVVEPKRTLKYVSFVDEPHIRMVDQQLLGKSLQDAKGQKVPRAPMDFTRLSKLPLSLPDATPAPAPGQPQEMQPLRGMGTPKAGDSPDWCQCGRCLPSQLPEDSKCLEELCCRRTPGPCITTSELFGDLVLSRSALRQLLLYQEPLLALDEEATNSRLRRCAYRCYAAWRFGPQDVADFGILPSCCRWRIRREFPRSHGPYGGFRCPY
ncbi:PREDICTED: P2X purinoceptor 7 isoform X2 [Chinchilla lanigera]|uniref:P2X purinoceptor n=1 Tax=Chinchilla lanigera TaxID=34839 RepID=A0A8C2VTL4_CHILA|nr:PREDICTED: P2X purinoceptor 7 isoform X2 [Chinchilla lanigera]